MIKWLSGSLCYNHASCKYWTWIEDYNGWDQTCHLKDANPGLTYLEGVISGGKNCMAPTGKDFEPYQHFFPLSNQTRSIANMPPILFYYLLHVQLPLI